MKRTLATAAMTIDSILALFSDVGHEQWRKAFGRAARLAGNRRKRIC
jgi:hypothetical protein